MDKLSALSLNTPQFFDVIVGNENTGPVAVQIIAAAGKKYLAHKDAQAKLAKRKTVLKSLTRPSILTRFSRKNKIVCCSDAINVFLVCGNMKRTVQIKVSMTLDQVCALHNIPMWDTWFSLNGKPLKEEVSLAEYGIYEGATIIQNVRMCGGSTDYRLYTHVYECEQAVLQEPWRCQAEALTEDIPADVMNYITTIIEKVRTMIPSDYEWLGELLESLFQVLYWLKKCENLTDYVTCTMLAYKLIVGQGVSTTLWKAFDTAETLQGDTFTKLTRDARDMFNTASLILDNPLTKKLKKIYTYLLVKGFLTKCGKDISVEEFLVVEAKAKPSMKDHGNMAMLIIDTGLVILERIDAYRLTGDWHALLHDDATYTTWVKDAEKLITLAPFTSNLAAHGTTYFRFISDLNDCVERGEAICRYSQKNCGMESSLMRKRLSTLQLIKNTEITRRASQKERKAPFGVLLHGGSSVGKSSFTKMLFYYYGKIHGLDTDDHYRYVRNPTDEYWSNFDSSKWCIQMDDIAFLLPSKTTDVDATLKEMLNVINNVPYVPPQAALEDKGKTPVMAKLVLATTNAPDLNAHEYFHCPLAVRRRLPYVVTIKPKKEFTAANGKFLDPTKVPKCEGTFPDFWIIEVQKLVPIEFHGRDSAKLETIKVFTDVRDFLKDFAKASLAHESNQESADACDVQMRDIKVCSLCFESGDDCQCLQGLVGIALSRTVISYLAGVFTDVAMRITAILIATSIYGWLCKFYVVRQATAMWTRFLDSGLELKFHSRMNGNRELKFKLAVRHVLSAGFVIMNMFLCYKASQWALNNLAPQFPIPTPKVEEEETTEEDEQENLVPQGNVLGTTEEQLLKEENQNVWYNPTIELSKFDVPTPSKSLVNLNPSEIRDLVAKNCVRIDVSAKDATHRMRMGAVFVRGQYLLFNRHALRKGTMFCMRITDSVESQGLTSNVDFHFDLSEVQCIPERDIALVRVTIVPPRKDILKFWNDVQIPVTRMLSVRRTAGGGVEFNELFNTQFCADFPVEQLGVSMDAYFSQGLEETKDGDCGALGIALTPQGPVILGIHTLGYKYTSAFPHTTKSDLEALMQDPLSQVEGGGVPLLHLNGEVPLVPPHHKSIIRYMPEGVVNVYGSLTGFRPKPRSRVCDTPLQKEMCDHFDYTIGYGKPVMSGWKPYYNNVVEMVKPFTDIDTVTLDKCVDGFVNDILGGLERAHGESWKGELCFLSNKAALNGLPGVKYIDRINVSTSMGFPWNTSKKQFLVADVDEQYPEGVTFTPEIWERVSYIFSEYAEGRRVYPVFTGHLKDEAVALRKILACKTRVFTGAPADWSVVVRSRLLTFVRLLQKNKFIFEAAPGAVAQSVEWTHFRDYLTQHGEDRLVAGDYGKFDKHMISTFVLAAFRIIGEVHKAAGFSDQEVRELYCIGMDTAFPLTNVAGDILEFFGTNPSGHPLTVIVNCLVNSLYMRYAYCKLNPAGESCEDFVRNVNLLTYGDDNVLNVSKAASWFDHTSIQSTLARIGVEYTMADKEAESRPYIHIDEVSFLKRSWRFEEELGMYVCPLEEDSIHKSLTKWVPSQTIDKFKQMVDVIVSANNEYFFYGRDTFEKHHLFFTSMLEQHPYNMYVTDSTLPSWDDLIERFKRASELVNPAA